MTTNPIRQSIRRSISPDIKQLAGIKPPTFAYLAVILDAFSRKAVGWAFDDTLDTSLAITALEKAIAARRPSRGSLIHHSDRGVQYASIAYRQRLAEHDITISMSRPGNPFDNAKAEP